MNTPQIERQVQGLLHRFSKEDYSVPRLFTQELEGAPPESSKERAAVAKRLLSSIDETRRKREGEILALAKGHPQFSPGPALRDVRKSAARMQGILDEILVRREMSREFSRAGEDSIEQNKAYRRLQEQLEHIEMQRETRFRRIDSEPIQDMTTFVFYSWQSDLPNGINRSLIQGATDRACKTLRDGVELDLVVDRDTLGEPGAPDIVETILRKIDRSSAFVADISILPETRIPNPNVLIEVGYALKTHGWGKVVLVMNTAYGDPEELPFNLRTKRVLRYELREGDDRTAAKRHLEKALANALRLILLHPEDSGEVADGESSGSEPSIVIGEIQAEARLNREARKDSLYVRLLLVPNGTAPIILNRVEVAWRGEVLKPHTVVGDIVVETADSEHRRPPLLISAESGVELQINLFHPEDPGTLDEDGELWLHLSSQASPVVVKLPPMSGGSGEA